jgi:hypothetical protein
MRLGCLFSMFSPMMKAVMARRTRKSLEMLKKLTEAGAPSPATTPTDFHKEL